jgi:hypothetical protein
MSDLFVIDNTFAAKGRDERLALASGAEPGKGLVDESGDSAT